MSKQKLRNRQEERQKFEAGVFDALADQMRPVDVASTAGISLETVYAIDRREAARRGIPRNLGEKTA